MPNHVYHHIAMSDLTDKQKEILKEIVATKNGLCGYYCPMPDEILNTTSPTRVVSETEYKKIMKENEKIDRTQDFFYEPKPITEKMQTALLEKYGTDNWYDWAHQNWGTKWGSYDSELDGDTLRFTTAWSPMHEEIITLFAMDFPTFTWHWEEEQGYGATTEYINGEFSCSEEFDIPQWEDIKHTDEGMITELLEGWESSDFREGADAGYYWDYDLYCPLTDEQIKQYINDK